MKTYVLKRLLLMIPTFFGVSLVVWIVLSSAPAPPLSQQVPTGVESGKQAGKSGEISDAVKIFRAQYNLDRPRVLNFYYDIDAAEVRKAVEAAGDVGGKHTIKEQNDAQEQIVNWGYYAVPKLLEIVKSSRGALRDQAVLWLAKNAERVEQTALAGILSPAQTEKNTEIVAENKILETYKWTFSAKEARKEAGVRAYETWYRGASSLYPKGVPTKVVAAALDSGDDAAIEKLGSASVPGLVELVLKDDKRRDAAIQALVRQAKLPEKGPGADPAFAAVFNKALRDLSWPSGAPHEVKSAGVNNVKSWWGGTASRWDYSGSRWLHVLFLETQFAAYWNHLLHFDLGYSLQFKEPVLLLVVDKLKYSLTLALGSLLLSYLISVPLGIYSAKKHGTLTERGMSLFVLALYSLPSFFVGVLVVRFLGQGQPGSLGLVPPGEFRSLHWWREPTLSYLGDVGYHVIAPILCMTYASFAMLSRFAKTGLQNVLRSDYVRTARAKGVSDFWVTVKHAARNGIIPVVTLLGTTLPVIVSGSFIIEIIFNIPGFGQLGVQSIFNRDFNVVVGVTLIVAVLTMVGILLSDLLYAIVDPRISFS